MSNDWLLQLCFHHWLRLVFEPRLPTNYSSADPKVLVDIWLLFSNNHCLWFQFKNYEDVSSYFILFFSFLFSFFCFLFFVFCFLFFAFCLFVCLFVCLCFVIYLVYCEGQLNKILLLTIIKHYKIIELFFLFIIQKKLAFILFYFILFYFILFYFIYLF